MRRYCQPSMGKGKKALPRYLNIIAEVQSNPIRIHYDIFDLQGYVYNQSITTLDGFKTFLRSNGFTGPANPLSTTETWMKAGTAQPYNKAMNSDVYVTGAGVLNIRTTDANGATYGGTETSATITIKLLDEIIPPI